MKSSKFTTSIILGVFITLILISCKSSHSASAQANKNTMTQLSSADNDKSFGINKGQKVQLTLPHPGDGGYAFNDPDFDKTILKLDTHTHNPPPKGALLGNFGTDVWIFSAIASGQTDLKVTASRSWAKNEKTTSFAIKLKVL